MSTDFLSLYFWLNIAGILLLSVVGAYLVRGVDIILSFFSSKWKTRVTQRKEKFDALVNLHLRDPQLLHINGIDLTVTAIRPFVSMGLLGLVMVYLHMIPREKAPAAITILMLIGMVIFTILSFIDMVQYTKLSLLFSEIKRRQISEAELS
jgi:hypothetical protein